MMLTDDELYTTLQGLGLQLTEEKFESLLTVVKAELESRIDIPLTVTSFIQTIHNFHGDKIVVDMFPVQAIHKLTINNKRLCEDRDYHINCQDGIIYLKQPMAGFLKLEYLAGLNVEEYQKHITPVLLLMLQDQLDTGWDKNASSITEGNVSVSYDTSLGLQSRIEKSITDLNNRFSAYMRMI